MDEMGESEGYFTDDESDAKEDEDEDKCPTIRLSAEEKKRIRKPWLKSLIVKVLGKRVGFKFLERQITQLWKPKAPFNLANLGNDFYLVRLGCHENHDIALFGSPWLIFDHYLTVS